MTTPPPGTTGAPADRDTRSVRLAGLVGRVADGDRQAFEELYDETAAIVHGTAVRVLRDPDLAADLTQDVMVEVWRTAARFDVTRGSVTAWVATMAHRRAVDKVRSVQAQRTRDEVAGIKDYVRPHDDVAETVEHSMERDRVEGCLGSLTDLQREAVMSAYYEGLTYREVAQDRGVALPTVKSRIRDGLNRLRECLGVDR
ncbi:ECF RNA polymerase sigma factor SigK [Sanguibacter suaedae]|uniref:ECF RNA polymerase sigma factor SigK n=1 Tax=Sanguibacter suaedae TaxID=2795737 RepID=A0A934I7M2_9MICO|nr:ECF RNA polymerase sigma factor SigK [Sanguibacter suaedae]MBI9113705.1 ECF RNA polymerase sigma factor SigK [Sanguibacter suaedae]